MSSSRRRLYKLLSYLQECYTSVQFNENHFDSYSVFHNKCDLTYGNPFKQISFMNSVSPKSHFKSNHYQWICPVLHQYNNSANESNPPLFIIIFGAKYIIKQLFYVNWTRWQHSTFSALHLCHRHPVVVIWHLSLGTFFLISDEFRGFSHVTFFVTLLSHACTLM